MMAFPWKMESQGVGAGGQGVGSFWAGVQGVGRVSCHRHVSQPGRLKFENSETPRMPRSQGYKRAKGGVFCTVTYISDLRREKRGNRRVQSPELSKRRRKTERSDREGESREGKAFW